jgi:creatinine amidohydrolase
MIEYTELTRKEIEALPRDGTVLVSSISPIEVHGSHLPVGTDYYVAKEVMNRFAEQMKGFSIIHLPDLPLGADVVGGSGSLPVKSRTLYELLLNWGTKLCEIGFRYWIVFDNHGAIKHQSAFGRAANKLLRKDFYLIAPFLHIFKEMLEDREEIGLPPGQNGNWYDAHAGTNETSLMLVARKDLVSEDLANVKKFMPTVRSKRGDLLRKIGYRDIANAVDWLKDPNNPFYMGAPAEAKEENGEIMLSYHVKRANELFQEARNGNYRPPVLYRGIIGVMSKLAPEW